MVGILSELRYTAIGFHGCPKKRAQPVIEQGVGAWPISSGWFGPGIYFWDNDPSTGEWWAKQRFGDSEPTLIGAELDLSKCLDLTNVFGQNTLRSLRQKANTSPQFKTKLEELQEKGYSSDGALIQVARRTLDKDSQFNCVRTAVHMDETEDTVEILEPGNLLAGFRMVIIAYDRSAIGNYEVSNVD